jgi:hypothetical protein
MELDMIMKYKFPDGKLRRFLWRLGSNQDTWLAEIFIDSLGKYFAPQKTCWGTLLGLDSHAFHMDCCCMLVYAIMNNAVLLPAKPHYFDHLARSISDRCKRIQMKLTRDA